MECREKSWFIMLFSESVFILMQYYSYHKIYTSLIQEQFGKFHVLFKRFYKFSILKISWLKNIHVFVLNLKNTK